MLKNITSLSFRFWLKSVFIVISMSFVHSVNAQQPLNGFPYTDSFKFPTSPGTILGGTNGNSSTVYSAFLTSSQTAVTTFGSVGAPSTPNSNQLVTADDSGGGYLRLTRTVTNQTGFARNIRTFPTSQGLSISFEYYTYGGAADGIVFSLFDADVVTRSVESTTAIGSYPAGSSGFQIGQFGGSIGYAQKQDNAAGNRAGITRGFLGIAFDEFGNFGTFGGNQGRVGGYVTSASPTLRVPNWVTLRGDGDGDGTSQPGFGVNTNYEYLIGVNTASGTAVFANASTATVNMGGTTFPIAAVDGAPASRTAGFRPSDLGYRKARIIVENIGSNQFRVNVFIDANTSGTMVTRHVIQDYIYTPTAIAPPNLSYAFSSSTGGSTNVHEIRAIDIAAPLSVPKTPVATSATTSTLEDNAVNLDLTTFAYDENGNSQLNWATGFDLDPIEPLIQASRTISGKGTFISNASGTVTFTPVADYNGTVSLDYTIADFGNLAASPTIPVSTSNAASLTITVTSVNDPPTTASKTVTTNEDIDFPFTATDFAFTDAFGDVPANFFDGIQITTTPATGTLRLAGATVLPGASITKLQIDAGSFTYRPPTNESASPMTSFTFRVQDDGGTANSGINLSVAAATMTINVLPKNDAPSGTDKVITINEDTSHLFSAADFGFTDQFDNPNNIFISVLVSLPSAGSLTFGGTPLPGSTTILAASLTTLQYIPPLNASGSSTATFTFQVKDDGLTANGGVDLDPTPNIITFNVLPLNDLPVVADIPKSGPEDATLPFTALDFTSKFTDVDGDALTKIKVINTPANGLLKVNGVDIIAGAEILAADFPNITFVPTANFNGSTTFKWNGFDGTAYATVDEDVNITITAVNDAPSFVKGANQTILTTAGVQTVTGWATALSKGPADEEASQTLTFTVTNDNPALFSTPPAISSAGVLTYTPSGTAGTTIVTVVLKDSGLTANGGVDTYTTQTFTITITAPAAGNTPPVVDVIPKVGTKDNPVPFTVADFTGKYTDGDSNPLNKIKIVTLPPSGLLKLDGVNITAGQEIPVADLAKITFVPASGFTGGPVTFQWNGSDGTDYAVTPKDVNINISATNAPPVAVADAYSTVKGGTLTVSAPGVLNNDSDPDANPITSIMVAGPANGTLTLNPNGSFTYVHNNGTSTSDSFTYKVNDGIVDGNTVTVTITINASNTPPVIVDIPKTGVIDQPVTFTAGDFTSKFTDPNGDALNKIRIVTLPPSGTLRLNGIPITVGQEIPAADLPNITFVPPAGFSGGPISFQWNGSDGTDYATVPKNVNITIDPTSISISVTEVCIGDVPWVQYTITGQGFTPAANSATIRWKKMDGTVVRELTNQALTGQLLWPGAAVDANGIPTAWPGWNFTGGQWVQISDGLRPQMRLHISINPETEVIVNYPPATPFCSANPNRPPVVSNITKSSTGFLPIPFTVTDFTSKYTDPDGDPLVKVRIQTLPPNGVLKLNGIPVTINQEIPVADLAKLTFEPALNWSGTTNFTWNGSDGDVYATSPANTALTVIAPSDPNAKIGLAKNLASVTPALNGTYDVKFVFTVVNFGPNGLENISIKDNIALAFGGTEVTVKTVTAFGNLKANSSFGLTNTELLLPGSRLLAGEEAKVELLINVKLLLTSGVFQNTATAEAISSLTGFKVTDVSTNGLRPDPNSTGDVSPSETTPIKLDPMPTYVPAGFSPNGDGMNDKFVVQNANGKHVSLEMYNRWGNRVYKSDDYKNDWGGEVTEGFFLGRDIPDGTYYYIIIIDKKDKYAGFITVNR